MAAARARFLMCEPTHFDVVCTINPWMKGQVGRVDRAKARAEWDALRRIVAERADVALVEPHPSLPDMAFARNAGFVLGRRAVVARFAHPERRGEEPHWRQWFEANGFETFMLPEGTYFEGGGDLLRDRARGVLWMGYGVRTVLEAAEPVSEALGEAVVPLRLVDERFYHLDTCFCPLDGGHLLWYPPALDDRSRRIVEGMWPEDARIAVAERDADLFACNAVRAGGDLILGDCSGELEARLRALGYGVVRTPLGEFKKSGGSASCLVLPVDEPAGGAPATRTTLARRTVALEGHLIDTGRLAAAMDRIVAGGGSFRTLEFRVGRRREDPSFVRLAVAAPEREQLERILGQLLDDGARAEDEGRRDARLVACDMDGVAPDDFYSTTIFPTDVLVDGQWVRCTRQRMDGVLVVSRAAGNGAVEARVTLFRDLRRGDAVVVGHDGVRIHARKAERTNDDDFQFMSSAASSERRAEAAAEHIAWEMKRIRERRGRIVFVAGPVVVHTGGIPYLCELVRAGYVQALLGGNAIAVHDIERAFMGTSLGVDLHRGVSVHGGHRHHLMAINAIRRCGSIEAAVETGVLKSGLMHEIVKHGIPFCLAGSIRDDGPLPDTQMDLVRAQAEYQELLRGAEMVVMLSSMLHSIGVGNMTPAGVRLVCVDISTAVATKLADRGSVESTPVVTDVGLFLNLLAGKLRELG